jgi:hypothetical protein
VSLSVCLSVCRFHFYIFLQFCRYQYLFLNIIMVKKKIRISYDDWKAKLDIFEYRWNNGKILLFRFLIFLV